MINPVSSVLYFAFCLTLDNLSLVTCFVQKKPLSISVGNSINLIHIVLTRRVEKIKVTDRASFHFNPHELKYQIKLRQRVDLFRYFRLRERRNSSNCTTLKLMRSPFLQTIYFEYYVRLGLVDEKLRRRNTSARLAAKKKI